MENKEGKRINKKAIIDKIITVIMLTIYLGGQICLFLFEKDVWEFLTNSKHSNLLSLEATLGYSILLTLIFVNINMLRQHNINNILRKKCDPQEYYERFLGLYLYANKYARTQNKMSCDFLSGDWDSACKQCFDVLQHSNNLALIQNAYTIMMQIYVVQGDNDNLNALRNSLMRLNVPTKKGAVFASLLDSANVFADYLSGNAEDMIDKYSALLPSCKFESDKNMVKFYLALALTRAGRVVEAIPLFEDVIKNANKLFVVEWSKKFLLAVISN